MFPANFHEVFGISSRDNRYSSIRLDFMAFLPVRKSKGYFFISFLIYIIYRSVLCSLEEYLKAQIF